MECESGVFLTGVVVGVYLVLSVMGFGYMVKAHNSIGKNNL